MVSIDLNKIDEYKNLSWGNYQAGVMSELKKDGYEICPCDMLYNDTLPHGGGLSSSAAIEVATALAFATLSNEKKGITAEVDMVKMALIGQRAENNYVGLNCGIMDQFASAMGKMNHCIYLNCGTLEYELVPLELGDYRLVLSNTNKKHSLGNSKYNERRAECEEGLAALKTVMPEITQLADVSVSEFEMHKGKIENPVVRRRIKHVVGECDRVHKSVRALKNGELETFGALMNASHDSLRDDYEVSCEELDTLVAEARKFDGVLGSRMTGAGFGGCTVSVVRKDIIDEFVEKIGNVYLEKFGHPASFYISEIGDGGREIKNI